MHIIFYRHSLLNRGGDKMVISHASALAKQGHIVTIQTSIVNTIFKIPNRVIVKKNKVSTIIGSLWIALTTKFMCDVLIADIIVLSTILSVRNRKRVIYFAQDYDESYYVYRIQQIFIRLIYCLGLCFFKIPTIAVSAELAEILKKRFKSKSDTVVNGVDLKQFYYDPSIELVLRKNKNIAILLLSRKDFRKGFDVGIKTIEEFQKIYKIPFEVWTVGDNPGNALSENHHHHFGYINENRLRQIMSSADIFLYPSRFEGFGLMVMEAFACKCPVITTEAVSYAIHEKTVLKSKIEDYRNLSDSLYRIVSDTKLKDKLVQNGFCFAEKNSLENSSFEFVKTISTLYKS